MLPVKICGNIPAVMSIASQKERIAVLTGGGDCPGLNAAIGGVVLSAGGLYDVVGIRGGFNGLMGKGEYRPLSPDDVIDSMSAGGTILGSSSKGLFSSKIGTGQDRRIPTEVMSEAVSTIKSLGIRALVVIGGDGSLGTAMQFGDYGVDVVGMPKTIDNDVHGTDRSIGFRSEVDFIAEMLDRLRSTAHSMERILVAETMGRNSGHLALEGGFAGGSDVIVIPEIPATYPAILKHIREQRERGQTYALITVAEGASISNQEKSIYDRKNGGEDVYGGIAGKVVKGLASLTDPDEFEIRAVTLGHLQRGGDPRGYDRTLGRLLGDAAVQAIKDGNFNSMVAIQGEQIVTLPLNEVVGRIKMVDPNCQMVRAARNQGVSFGD